MCDEQEEEEEEDVLETALMASHAGKSGSVLITG